MISGRVVAVGALVVLGAVGCSSSAIRTATTTTATTGSAAAAHLVEVHDPGHVTGIVPRSSCHALPGPRPDPGCTPGAIDPAVTQANIQSTICRSGYTAKVRPPTGETDRLKHTLYAAYGIPAGTTSELDHLVSLELGGANDAANLWPEVGKVPNPKDSVENDLHDAVCSGKVTLAAAQQAIASNWQSAETVLGVGRG